MCDGLCDILLDLSFSAPEVWHLTLYWCVICRVFHLKFDIELCIDVW